jgi:chemotaxis protein methyltransferase CheR
MYSITDDEFQAFQHLIYTETGITLNESKRCLVCSRLSKRLRSLRLTSYLDYYDYLLRRDNNGEELQRMVNCITTNKTDFFREPHHFRFLTKPSSPSWSLEPRAAGRAACESGAPRRRAGMSPIPSR